MQGQLVGAEVHVARPGLAWPPCSHQIQAAWATFARPLRSGLRASACPLHGHSMCQVLSLTLISPM